MDLRQLRYFLEIVEQGSFSRAAARLNVAQPALSIHVRNMEADLGAPLLLRSRGGVRPTDAGLILVRHARFILNEQAKVEDEIRSLGKEPAGEVRVGLPGTISDILTVPLIEAVRRKYPRIRMTVSEAMSGFVGDWLHEGHVDLAVLYALPATAALQSERLLDEELVAISAPRHLTGETVDLAQLSRCQLILPSKAHGLRQMIDAAFDAQGATLQLAVEVDSYKSIKALVMRGFGVSILPQHAVADERLAGRISVLMLTPRLLRSAYLVHRANAPLSITTELVRETLREVAADLVRQGRWAGAGLAGG